MLIARVLSGLIMLIIVLLMTFKTNLFQFEVAFGVLMLVAAWEWAGLVGISRCIGRLMYVLVVGLVMGYMMLHRFHYPLVWLACVFWLYAIFLVLLYQGRHVQKLKPFRWFHGLMGWVVLLGAWAALILLRQKPGGTYWVLGSMCLVWIMDTFAYISGRLWGKRKLCSRVSPNKTIAGLVGGVVWLVVITVALFKHTGHWPIINHLEFVSIVAGAGVLSVFGDLFESVLKRTEDLKDSGRLIPGHGGVLDRLDALLLGVTVFAAFVYALSIV